MNVQHFFEPFYDTDNAGNLVFFYGSDYEHYGMGYHRLPIQAAVPWTAGTDGNHLKQVFVCSSAMEAIAYLALHHHQYTQLDALYFTTGTAVPKVKITLLYGNDLLGRLWDIKTALLLRNKPIQISYLGDEKFRFGNFTELQASQISLSAFEKSAGVRTGIRTAKPNGFSSFLEQLTH